MSTTLDEHLPPHPVDWRAVRDRGCGSKQALGEQVARRMARDLTAELGTPIDAYPCPWCAIAWHIGHRMSVESLATLAAALRARREDPDPT